MRFYDYRFRVSAWPKTRINGKLMILSADTNLMPFLQGCGCNGKIYFQC